MTITTIDQLLDALGNNSSRIVIDKVTLTGQVAGSPASMWTPSGVPGAGANPTTPAVCTKALVGSLNFANQTAPATSYLAWLSLICANAAQTVEIHDRLAHMGGLSGTVTTAQTVGIDLSAGQSPGADRRGDANYSDVQWWLEWYTATGATGVNATVNVTYDDGSTGNLAAIALGTSVQRGRMFPLISAVAGRFIRSVNSVTLSATTGTAGNFGVTATRPRTMVDAPSPNTASPKDWAQLGLPEIPNDSCLMLVVYPSTTATGTVRGQGKIAHG